MPGQETIQKNQVQQNIQVSRQENVTQQTGMFQQQEQNVQDKIVLSKQEKLENQRRELQSALDVVEEKIREELKKPDCPELVHQMEEKILSMRERLQKTDNSLEVWAQIQEMVGTIFQGYENMQMSKYYVEQGQRTEAEITGKEENIRNMRNQMAALYESVKAGRSYFDSDIYTDFCEKFAAYQENGSYEEWKALIAACNTYVTERSKRRRRTGKGKTRLENVRRIMEYARALELDTMRNDIEKEKASLQKKGEAISGKLKFDLQALEQKEIVEENTLMLRKNQIYNEKSCLKRMGQRADLKQFLVENSKYRQDQKYQQLELEKIIDLNNLQANEMRQFYDSASKTGISAALPEVGQYKKQMESADGKECVVLALQVYQYVTFYDGSGIEYPEKLKQYKEIADNRMNQFAGEQDPAFIKEIVARQTEFNGNVEKEFIQIKSKLSDLGQTENIDDASYSVSFYTPNYNMVRAINKMIENNNILGQKNDLVDKIKESQDDKDPDSMASIFDSKQARELDFELFHTEDKEEQIKDIRRYNVTANEKTYQIIAQISQQDSKRKKSIDKLYKKLEAEKKNFNSADIRNLHILKPYDTDENGNPKEEKDVELKNKAERFILAVFGNNQEFSRKVYQEYFEQLANTEITEDLLNPEYVAEHYEKVYDIEYQILMIQNMRDAQPEVYQSLDQELLDRVNFLADNTRVMLTMINQILGLFCINNGKLIEKPEKDAKSDFASHQKMIPMLLKAAKEEIKVFSEKKDHTKTQNTKEQNIKKQDTKEQSIKKQDTKEQSIKKQDTKKQNTKTRGLKTKYKGTDIWDVNMPAFQTSGNGCWSVAAQLLLQNRGINVTQEQIRDFQGTDYEPWLTKEILKNRTQGLLETVSSLFTDVVPDACACTYQYRQDNIDSFKAGVTEGLRHGPVALLEDTHYRTIIGIKGDMLLIKDSLSNHSKYPNQIHEVNINDLIQRAKNSSSHSIELTWLEDITEQEKQQLYDKDGTFKDDLGQQYWYVDKGASAAKAVRMGCVRVYPVHRDQQARQIK